MSLHRPLRVIAFSAVASIVVASSAVAQTRGPIMVTPGGTTITTGGVSITLPASTPTVINVPAVGYYGNSLYGFPTGATVVLGSGWGSPYALGSNVGYGGGYGGGYGYAGYGPQVFSPYGAPVGFQQQNAFAGPFNMQNAQANVINQQANLLRQQGFGAGQPNARAADPLAQPVRAKAATPRSRVTTKARAVPPPNRSPSF